MFGYILYKYRVANTVVVDDVFPPQVVDLALDCVVEKIAEGQHEVLFYSAYSDIFGVFFSVFKVFAKAVYKAVLCQFKAIVAD